MSLNGWAYRKSHTITHPTGSLTNYQTKIRVYRTTGTDTTSTVYVGDKCRTDYGDIRFTNAAGTELDYWIELDAGSYADFWVKLDTITTSATFYIYYGNSSATTTSNGDTTFLFYDGFESADTSGWTTVYGTGGTIVQNTSTKYHGTGSGQFTTSTSSTDVARRKLLNTSYTGCILEYKVMRPTTSGRVHVANINSYGGGRAGMSYVVMYNGYFAYYVSGFTNVVAFSANTWYKVKLVMAPGTTTYSIYINDTLYASPTLIGSATSIYEVGIGGYNASTSIYFDDITVRTYASSDVVHEAWGSEESLQSPLAGWAYRQSHIINGSVTDYQVKLTLQYGSGTSTSDTIYLNTHARPDFGDVRFTDSNGNLLSYWIESYTLATSATVWVKGTFSGDTTIYVYYGNENAGTTSNGHTTFIFFDDFESGVSGWSTETGTIVADSTTVYSGSYSAKFTSSTNGASNAYKTISPLTSYVLEAAVRNNSGTVTVYSPSVNNGSFTTAQKCCRIDMTQNGTAGNWQYHDTSYHTIEAYAINTWYKLKYVVKSTSQYDFYINNTLKISNIAPQGSPTQFDRVFFGAYHSGGSAYVDNIFIRKYATEPIHGGWGAEQDIGATSFTIRITPTTGTDPLSVTYNCIIPEGTLTNFTLSYGDGNEYTSASQTTFSTTHVYSEPGTYTVWAEGYTEFATHMYYEIPYGVNVSAPAITTYYTFNQTYNTIQFHDETIGTPTEWYWTFGDGSHSYKQHPIHTYNVVGTYQVTLYSSNQYQYDLYIASLTIPDVVRVPDARFTPSYQNIIATPPYTVQFVNLTGNPYGTSYLWNFGDTGTSTDENPSHTFATTGSYNVSLVATNTLGSSTKIYIGCINIHDIIQMTFSETVRCTDQTSRMWIFAVPTEVTRITDELIGAIICREQLKYPMEAIADVPGLFEDGRVALLSTISLKGHEIINGLTKRARKLLFDPVPKTEPCTQIETIYDLQERVVVTDSVHIDEDV